MKDTNPLLIYLRDPATSDKRSPVICPAQQNRVRPSFVSASGGWSKVVQLIQKSASFRVSWFPDANIMFLDQTDPVWQALRAAALGAEPLATITGPVKSEAKEWLEDPHHHQDRAKAIKDAIENRTWIKKFGLEADSTILPAIYGYLRLLGLRRFLAVAPPGNQTIVDTDPVDKSHTMNMIGNKIGARAQELARKGRKDLEKSGQVSINDELQCLLAISHALLHQTDTIILTTDQDLIEIFYKAQWMVNTHYRSYLAAPMVKAGEFGEPAGTMEDTEGFFDGPLTLYRRRTEHLLEVLPKVFRQVTVTVLYVTPDNMIQKLTFPFELGMLGMFELRAKTGRCTDLFGSHNIHVELGPLKRHLDGLFLGVGRDHGDWRETNGVKTFLPRLDQEYAMNCRERHA